MTMTKAYDFGELAKRLGAAGISLAVTEVPLLAQGFTTWLKSGDLSKENLKKNVIALIPQIGEDVVISATKVLFQWFKDSAALSPSTIDDLFATLLGLVEGQIIALEDKITDTASAVK